MIHDGSISRALKETQQLGMQWRLCFPMSASRHVHTHKHMHTPEPGLNLPAPGELWATPDGPV